MVQPSLHWAGNVQNKPCFCHGSPTHGDESLGRRLRRGMICDDVQYRGWRRSEKVNSVVDTQWHTKVSLPLYGYAHLIHCLFLLVPISKVCQCRVSRLRGDSNLTKSSMAICRLTFGLTIVSYELCISTKLAKLPGLIDSRLSIHCCVQECALSVVEHDAMMSAVPLSAVSRVHTCKWIYILSISFR